MSFTLTSETPWKGGCFVQLWVYYFWQFYHLLKGIKLNKEMQGCLLKTNFTASALLQLQLDLEYFTDRAFWSHLGKLQGTCSLKNYWTCWAWNTIMSFYSQRPDEDTKLQCCGCETALCWCPANQPEPLTVWVGGVFPVSTRNAGN